MKVAELIELLKQFEGDKLVIMDEEGNTWDCPTPELWDESKPWDSPVAFFIN